MIEFRPRNGFLLVKPLKDYAVNTSSNDPTSYGEIKFVSPEAEENMIKFNPSEKIMFLKEDYTPLYVNGEMHYLIHQSKVMGIFDYNSTLDKS